MRLALLPSPLLGPATWAPVADRLRERGARVVVPDLPPVVRTPHDVLDGWRDLGGAVDEPVVLVPHSNAGLYVAALAQAHPVAGVVFVDAGLPQAGETPVAPAGLRAHLAGLISEGGVDEGGPDERGADGLLPPWTRWWDPADVDGLFPDAATRAAVAREERRLPLDYFHARVPSPAGWERLPVGYLGFGDTYAEEQAAARRRGWPVEVLDGQHLHPLVDPDGVARALGRVLAGLGVVNEFP